jgi:hypothetical protein
LKESAASNIRVCGNGILLANAGFSTRLHGFTSHETGVITIFSSRTYDLILQALKSLKCKISLCADLLGVSVYLWVIYCQENKKKNKELD